MIRTLVTLLLTSLLAACSEKKSRSIFDVHLHGAEAPEKQISNLEANGVRIAALSSSWRLQQSYKSTDQLNILQGLMLPCPAGKVPYSLQSCFDDDREWPDLNWVEQQMVEKRIDFLGEVLTQYQGISSSDSMMFPYYQLALKYQLPVGIHTGSAGPDHGSPNFKEEMGNPLLLTSTLDQLPGLKVWLMHAGAPFVAECIELMKKYPRVYTDISVINNPAIVPAEQFAVILKQFIEAGLEDRLMFGTDNADIEATVAAVENLPFLSEEQKEKIFWRNAKQFFRR
jgi:hypothetical protein